MEIEEGHNFTSKIFLDSVEPKVNAVGLSVSCIKISVSVVPNLDKGLVPALENWLLLGDSEHI